MSLSGQCRPVEKRHRRFDGSRTSISFKAFQTLNRLSKALAKANIDGLDRSRWRAPSPVPCRRKRSAMTSSTRARPGGRSDLRCACACEAARGQPLFDVALAVAGRQFHREGDDQARIASFVRATSSVDGLRRDHGAPGAVWQSNSSAARAKQQLEVVVQLGHGADRARGSNAPGWSGRSRWPAARRRPDRPPASMRSRNWRAWGAEGLDVAALPLGIQRVEDRLDLPEPLGPSPPSSRRCGCRVRFFRLCWRAPRMRMLPDCHRADVHGPPGRGEGF